MLDLKLLIRELDSRKDEIVKNDEDTTSICDEYRAKLPSIDSLDRSSNERLGKYSGCKVLEEGEFTRRFRQKFESRQQATDWALENLKDTRIAAVDGSQVYPSQYISVPIGLTQACTVINGHAGRKSFSTSSTLKLMTPADLEESGGYGYSQSPVSRQRFEMECAQICEFVETHPGDIIFMDGSLVLSFIVQLGVAEQKKYVNAMVEVLDCSEKTGSPVVAYTDMSMSRDLSLFMSRHFGLRPTTHLSDAIVIKESLNWGDRTRAFLSDRDDRLAAGQPSVLDMYGKHKDSIAFFYIQSSGGLPSKVEIPAWCVEKGMTDRIADVIRAQCIVRPGYPDIIHRAHEYATINFAESELFTSMLESLARKHNIRVYKSAKEFNKQI